MHIGLITYGLDRPPTGIGRYSIELITSLSDLGIPVTLVGNSAPYLPNSTMYPLARMNGCRLLPGLVTLGNFLLPPLVRKTGVDIIHDPTGIAPFFLGAGDARTVVTVQDMFASALPGTSTWLEMIITRFWLPLVLKRVDAVITGSEWSKKDIRRFTKMPDEKIHVIPLGQRGFAPVDRRAGRDYLSRWSLEPGYILTVSSFEPRRNLPRLLEAYARLRLEGERRRLVIVGAPRLKKDPLIHLIPALGLEGWVICPGYVSERDLPVFYGCADLFVFPSLYEGFGFPVLEALACGTPVIAANATAIPEVAGDAAVLVDPYKVDSLTEAMRRVLADLDLRNDLIERGLRRAEKFTWPSTAARTAMLYQELLS